MTRKMFRGGMCSLVALTFLITFHQTVLAGPPLICWPFEIGHARSLPWGSSGWRDTKADYDVTRLADDTVALLTPDLPVIARMETLRRATIYAMKNPRVASELYSRLMSRARHSQGKTAALESFDLGYLIESYKQAAPFTESMNFVKEIDGYALVVKAIGLSGGDPTMEFAAALMSGEPQRRAQREHLQRAIAAAPDGSLLAQNIASHFGDRRKKN